MNDELETCERCGGTLELVAQVGELQTFRCACCGLERQALVAFVDPSRIEEKDMPEVNLVLHWRTVPPHVVEIACLRRHFPVLASVPLREFAAKIGNSPSFVVGSFLKVHAEALIERLSGSGLNLRIEV